MLFGTSGIRGNAEKLFTEQFCFDIGRSFTKFLANRGIKGDIAIGMDPRESSERIKYDVARGFATKIETSLTKVMRHLQR